MSILVTGGAGYIGSHTVVELLEHGYHVVIADNFQNSSPTIIERIKKITSKDIKFFEVDLHDKDMLEEMFKKERFEAVMHFAGLKAVGESVLEPLKYYANNLISTIYLCEMMKKYNVKKMVFSSSAAVYGMQNKPPFTEEMEIYATSPYGQTKIMIEQIFRDIFHADESWSIALLRYFNPIGAHESGQIGEEPNGVPNNLLPYIMQVATRKRKILNVFGNDYLTHDGTGVRDYIHVIDLAKGHLKALEHVCASEGMEIYNLGSGQGTSVLDLLSYFEKASGIRVPYKITDRRQGDTDTCIADTRKALMKLGWKAEKTIEESCRDAWRWECRNLNIDQSEYFKIKKIAAKEM